MPIDFDTYSEIVSKIRGDLAVALPDVDPTIHGSWAKAFGDALAGRAYDLVITLQQLLQQAFPQTAEGEYLEMFAEWEGLTRNAATAASGDITITGTVSSVIPIDTEFSSSEGNLYLTDAEVTIASQVVNISTLTRSGVTATATASADHNLATGMTITIAGANETDYNGSYEITVISATEFTYTVSGSPSTPATGTITGSYDGIEATVTSSETGADLNLDSGASLNLTSPISGVDTEALVQYEGITASTDAETDDNLETRVLQSRSNPVANFNVAAITKAVLAVPGVTRVKVKRITPEIGDVTILFVRDNDTGSIIPDAGEVQDVEDAVDAIAPANISSSQIYVTAPTPVTTNYVFASVTPNTTTMKAAIEANLQAMYEDSVDFETILTEDKYRSAIIDTIDPDTGDELSSFILTSPSGDIAVTTDEIAILGTVSF